MGDALGEELIEGGAGTDFDYAFVVDRPHVGVFADEHRAAAYLGGVTVAAPESARDQSARRFEGRGDLSQRQRSGARGQLSGKAVRPAEQLPLQPVAETK